MAKWEFKVEREGKLRRIKLLRGGSVVGSVYGAVQEPAAGPKYFDVAHCVIKDEYQQEYREVHNGLKMGGALRSKLLELLKGEDLLYIFPRWSSEIFLEGSRGIFEKTPDGQLLKINREKVLTMEKAKMRMIERSGRRVAPKRIVGKAKGILRRPSHRLPK